MPFVKQELRQPLLDQKIKPEAPGDLCFLEYAPLMFAWKESRRWTTAHNEFKRMFGTSDETTAKVLAYLEFYIRHIHKYEDEKLVENGDI